MDKVCAEMKPDPISWWWWVMHLWVWIKSQCCTVTASIISALIYHSLKDRLKKITRKCSPCLDCVPLALGLNASFLLSAGWAIDLWPWQQSCAAAVCKLPQGARYHFPQRLHQLAHLLPLESRYTNGSGEKTVVVIQGGIVHSAV